MKDFHALHFEEDWTPEQALRWHLQRVWAPWRAILAAAQFAIEEVA